MVERWVVRSVLVVKSARVAASSLPLFAILNREGVELKIFPKACSVSQKAAFVWLSCQVLLLYLVVRPQAQ